MALKSYQTELQLNTLYKVSAKGGINGTEQIKPNIWVKTGSVDVYGSNYSEQPTIITDMRLHANNTNIFSEPFGVIPTYIYIVENTATATGIIVSGLDVENLGAFPST